MSILNAPCFHDEKAAYAKLESLVWPTGPICPHCGGVERISAITGKSARPGLKFCGQCRKQFTVKVGTVFESSHVPLHKWLQAAYLMASSKKGISAHQLHRTLQVTYKTAWFIEHRLREAMKDGSPLPLGGEGKVIEADETFLGPSPKEVIGNRVRRPSGGGRHKIVSLVERGGKSRSVNVVRINSNSVKRILMQHADTRSKLHTDQAPYYWRAGYEFAGHDHVNHGRGEYVRGDVHTNTIEGFFSIFKRGMKGIYQHCSERHIHRYLAEFDFRYSNRVALGVDDESRTDKALAGIVGKRLLYRDSSGGA